MIKEQADKILVLGVDGMDPRLTKKYLGLGVMPNVAKLIERGATREDLVMLGAQPTITPPMWTTLSTGAYPMTHGITDFWCPTEDILTHFKYSMNSHNCKAEPLWNVFAEAGKKTMVWHWPGNSWPPTSESPNLMVVDGLQPTSINTIVSKIDWEKIVWAQKDIDVNQAQADAFEVERGESGAGCVIDDLEVETGDKDVEMSDEGLDMFNDTFNSTCDTLLMDHNEGEGVIAFTKQKYGNVTAYGFANIKPAKGWAFDVPESALEFNLIVNNGLERRVALMLPNEAGEFTNVQVYQSKKDDKPLVVLESGVMNNDVIEMLNLDGIQTPCSRQYRMFDLATDGSSVKVYMSAAMNTTKPDLFHPHSLYKEIQENVGEVPYAPIMIGCSMEAFNEATFPSWDHYIDWQAGCLNYVIEKHGVEVIFSHLHNVDYCGHSIWYDAVKREKAPLSNPEEQLALMQTVYEQTDKYVGKFLHLLDEGWTIFLVSDHGLLTSYEEDAPSIGDAFGTNIGVMKELGYTVLKKDEDGNELKEIDWTKTTAVAARGIYIYINLIGRNSTGIVAPEDKYELERKIIDDLYAYRDKETGKRIINMAMRNKEAVLLGVGGEDCGDIIYFCEEGFNRNHGDAISTTLGFVDTSVSPIFIAAGKGIKEGFTTKRIIREVDVAPTVAWVAGVRMPNECEGAPVYQIVK